MSMYCQSCGSSNKIGAKFCCECGNSFSLTPSKNITPKITAASSAANTPAQSPQLRRPGFAQQANNSQEIDGENDDDGGGEGLSPETLDIGPIEFEISAAELRVSVRDVVNNPDIVSSKARPRGKKVSKKSVLEEFKREAGDPRLNKDKNTEI